MAWRESYYVPPMIHGQPIPTATRVGNMLFTSFISGRDPETGETPNSAAAQASNAFKLLAKILAAAGATAEDVADVTVSIKEAAVRDHVSAAWVEMFPEENSRPARRTTISPELAGFVQIHAVAVIQER